MTPVSGVVVAAAVIVGVILVAALYMRRLLKRIDKAVETANGILLGALADRQQAALVDEIPMAERSRSQQAYVDRRDHDDAATRTAERQEDFDRGRPSGESG